MIRYDDMDEILRYCQYEKSFNDDVDLELKYVSCSFNAVG